MCQNCLTLLLYISCFDDAIHVLLEMVDKKLDSPQSIAAATLKHFEDLIKHFDNHNSIAKNIQSIAAELIKPEHNGRIPSTKQGLLGCNVDETVASLLMQHVFGSTELLVGLDTRKLLVALDMVDWEESGVKEKTDIKMAKVPAERVRKSLATWLPKGEGRTFQEFIENIGQILGANPVGFWGRLSRTLSQHFSSKDKKELQNMAENIVRFYKVTKSGGRRRPSCS